MFFLKVSLDSLAFLVDEELGEGSADIFPFPLDEAPGWAPVDNLDEVLAHIAGEAPAGEQGYIPRGALVNSFAFLPGEAHLCIPHGLPDCTPLEVLLGECCNIPASLPGGTVV